MKTIRNRVVLFAPLLLAVSSAFAQPTVSIEDKTVAESAGVVSLAVALSEVSASDVTVAWSTSDGTAQAGSDYTTASGSLVITAGNLSGTVEVPVLDDSQPELAQDFHVNLSAPMNAVLGDASGKVTISESDVTVLSWDDGSSDLGTAAFQATASPPGSYVFRISSQESADGGWRTALRVDSGNADLYFSAGAIPTTTNHQRASNNAGSDGWVLRPDQYSIGHHYILVQVTQTATWSLYSGNIHVQNLGALQFTDGNGNTTYDIGEAVQGSGSGPVAIGPEGRRFFSNTIPTGTPAWSLWLNGDPRNITVRRALAGFPEGGHDRVKAGHLLLVPDYIGTGSDKYFISVSGTPGETVNLDSRIQFVEDIAFPATVNGVSPSGAPYRVFRTEVPINQLAWDVSTTPVNSVNSNVAVRRNAVPSEWTCDAFSEASGTVTDSVTLVPDYLSNGTWFITVYGDESFSCNLRSGTPVVTPMAFSEAKTNDLPDRAGWRYYAVTDIPSQLGNLGWELLLSNQQPDTQISVRRNMIPGRWQSRTNGHTGDSHNTYAGETGHYGFIQRPAHQADVWYVGVYRPQQALGAFGLDVHPLNPPVIALNGASVPVSGQKPGQWKFFRFDVPGGIKGWDLRVKDVSGPVPTMSIRRGELPPLLEPINWIYPWESTQWPEGYEWAAGLDWTRRNHNFDGTPGGAGLVSALGKPLESATYYVGIRNYSDSADTSYTLVSRGIGAGQVIPIADLAFAAGSEVTVSNLAPREAAHFKVTVPPGMPSWEFTLSPSAGEMLIQARKDFIAPFEVSPTPTLAGGGSIRISKTGPERYVVLPRYGETTVEEGDYYLSVVSVGENVPDNNTTGQNVASGVLRMNGPLAMTSLGTFAPESSGITHAVALAAGQVKAYSFTLPEGLANVEVRLENALGNLEFRGQKGSEFPSMSGYGVEGGKSDDVWSDSETESLVLPEAGEYRLMIQAGESGDASATLRIVPRLPEELAFDGGVASVSGHEGNTWKFFRVVVPAGVLGWDARVKNVSGPGVGFFVRRDQLPLSSTGVSATDSEWPSGEGMAGVIDWTYLSLNEDGTAPGHGIVATMGRPLQPGVYYIGLYNYSSTGTSYTLQSRGIGDGQMIPVGTLGFAAGNSVSVDNLAARDAAYFKVTVPAATPSWEFTLTPSLGGMTLAARLGALPSFGSHPAHLLQENTPGVSLGKEGQNRFVLLPPPGQASIVPGDYYLAAVSEGDQPNPNVAGTHPASGVLQSNGSLPISDLGNVAVVPIHQPVSLLSGQVKAFRFTVPANTPSIRLSLENITGQPIALLRRGTAMPGPQSYINWYGFQGGETDDLRSFQLPLTLANPESGTYTLFLRDDNPMNGSSADLHIEVGEPQDLAFDQGVVPVTGHKARSWKFFRVVVPAGPAGWDLRLKNINSGGAQLVVRRDFLPVDSGAPENSNLLWDSGEQKYGGNDWTYRSTNMDGSWNDALVTSMGDILQPGTYYVGVHNNGDMASNYTLVSRGIGGTMSIPITNLDFSSGSSAAISALAARDDMYFRVVVPPGTPTWEFVLDPTLGEMLMTLRKGWIPATNHGTRISKPGAERFLMLADWSTSAIEPGEYFIAVTSEGVDPDHRTGPGTCDGQITSLGSLGASNIGVIPSGGVIRAVSLFGGQIKAHRFSLPEGVERLEVRLENRVGNPVMALADFSGGVLPAPLGTGSSYGYQGGGGAFRDSSLITVDHPGTNEFVLVTYADNTGSGHIPASADIRITAKAPVALNFAAELNGNGESHSDSRNLADGEKITYQVDVPETFGNQPIIGWILRADVSQGSLRFQFGNSGFFQSLDQGSQTMVVAPPLFTPGQRHTFTVEADAQCSYTLTSAPVVLERGPWTLASQFNQEFADSGEGLSGDQGIDLGQDDWHFYAMDVPEGNPGLLRAELQAINGNPDLFIRKEFIPTTIGNLHQHDLTGTGTEYGNWVPANGRAEDQLTPGRWYLGVRAAGQSNARYRLKLSTGQVTELNLAGGSVTGQNLAGGDWRYYKFTVPENAPLAWDLTFSQQFGDVKMWMRDITPPGDGRDYLDPIFSASSDEKNTGPYPADGVTVPGTYTTPLPPLRPGSVYFVGFQADGDSTFSFSSQVHGGNLGSVTELPYEGGSASFNLAGGSSVLYKVLVPESASNWYLYNTHGNDVTVQVENGTLPPQHNGHFVSSGGDSAPNFSLGFWPWVAGHVYYVRVTNHASSVRPVALSSRSTRKDPEIVLKNEAGTELPSGSGVVAFGNLQLGYEKTVTITVQNDGEAPLQYLNPYLSGTDYLDFFIEDYPDTPVAPGESVTFTVSFNPSAPGNRSAQLNLANDDPDESSYTVDLTGNGLSLPDIATSDGTVNFVDGVSTINMGAANVGQSASDFFFLRNTGTEPLTGISVAFDGPNASDFSFDNNPPTSLAAGESRLLFLSFRPGGSGTRTAALHISSNDPDEDPFDIALTGTGLGAGNAGDVQIYKGATALAANTALPFGAVGLGGSAPMSLTIKNVGSGTLGNISCFTAYANEDDFVVAGPLVTSLAPNASTNFTVTFSPSAAGSRTTYLYVTSNDPDESYVAFPLSGTGGSPEIAVLNGTANLADGGAASYGNVNRGTNKILTLTVKNAGTANLTGIIASLSGGNASDFAVTTAPGASLAPNATTKVSVRFTPSAEGKRSTTLRIASNDADENPFDIKLTGSGLNVPEIAVLNGIANLADGGAASYGNVNRGTNKILTLTVKNAGTANLTGIAASLSGGNASDFAVTTAPGASLAPNATTKVSVRFTPSASGTRSTTLRIASNDADENPFDIKLTGSGLNVPEIALVKGASNLADGGAVSFGSVNRGKSTDVTLTVRNAGTAALSGLAARLTGGNPGDFKVLTAPASSLAPGASSSVVLRFTPSAGGSRRTTLAIASNDADENPFDVILSGTGVNIPEIELLQGTKSLVDGKATVAFGSVQNGKTKSITLTVKNTGHATLTGISAVRSGAGAPRFAITTAPAVSLQPGASTRIVIRFQPNKVGVVNATLVVSSNDADESHFTLKLTGTGTKPKAKAARANRGKSGIHRGSDHVRYRMLTVEKTGTAGLQPLIEVSSDLVHWSSGPAATVTLHETRGILKVRDRKPLSTGKRFIRVRWLAP